MNLYLEVSEDRERFPGFVVFFGCSGCGGRLRISAICSVGFAFGGAGAALPVHPSDKTVRSYVCR